MSILSALGKTLSAGIDLVVIPVDVVKDVLTCGGAMTDEPCATKERLVSVYEQLKDACDKLGESSKDE